ncbi:RNA-directed DNA polymerase, eukaryota, reverse transcriptase zinc-binding domain protein [Tanacetum coccineum]
MKVSEYRPIACCNVFYKIICKILTNRLKSVLCRIISKNQSAFIPQRSITDNIMITQELLKSYGSKNGKSRCAFKIDIMKEYDIVNWDFFESVMRGFGFPNNFIRWVMTCVRSSIFLVSLNGERFGYFKGGRGLRQGDPMSPYLFIIVMEMLNLILERKMNQTKRFTYHHRCEELKITNLCFVDDLLILSNRDVNYVSVIREALEEFSDVSGLYPNLSKSVMFCSNVNEETKEVILQTVPFTIRKLPAGYNSYVLSFQLCKPNRPQSFLSLKLSSKRLLRLSKASIGNQGSKVDWHDVVWYSNFIPRHAFIQWLLVHVRLPTQDRLAKWYPNKNIWIVVKKLVFDVTIYFLWQERNIRLFQKVKRTEEDLWKVIEGNINMKLSGLRVTESSCVREKEWKFMDCLMGSVDMVGKYP